MRELVDGKYIKLMKKAWSTDPNDRPSMKEIVQEMQKISKASGTSKVKIHPGPSSQSATREAELASTRQLTERMEREKEEAIAKMKRDQQAEIDRLKRQQEEILRKTNMEEARKLHEKELQDAKLREEKERKKALRLKEMKQKQNGINMKKL